MTLVALSADSGSSRTSPTISTARTRPNPDRSDARSSAASINGGSTITSGDAVVTFMPGAPIGAESTITPSVTTASVDDASPVITVQAIDQYGNFVLVGGADVELTNDNTGPLDVTDVGDGTYTAPVVETVAPQTDSISGTINGDVITSGDAEITFLPGAPVGAESTITASVITASVDDASPVITVQAIDQYGNLLTEGGADVDLANDNTGSLDVNDEGDGTYTAPVVETVAPQTDTISGSINGDRSTTGDAEIEFTPGAPSVAQTTIEAAPATVNVDIHHSDITVTAKDQFGNLVGEGGATITLAGSHGTVVSPPADIHDGTYTSSIEDTVTRQDTITGKLAGVPITDAATVDFTPGALHHFTVGSPGTQTAGTQFTVTVTAYDQYNNIKTNYSGAPTVTHTLLTSPGGAAPSVATPPSVVLSSFVNGVATLTITTYRAEAIGRHIHVDDSGKTGDNVTDFIVLPGPLASFTIASIVSPRTAGSPFTVTATAYDPYGNVKTNYSGAARPASRPRLPPRRSATHPPRMGRRASVGPLVSAPGPSPRSRPCRP